MTALAVLLLSAIVPQVICRWAKGRVIKQQHADKAAEHRLRAPRRRLALSLSIAQLLLAWVAGCLALDSTFAPRFPGAAAIAFGSLCMTLAFTSCATVHPYGLGTPLPFWETLRRSVRWSGVFVAPIFVSYALAHLLLDSWLLESTDPRLRWALASLVAVACVAYVGVMFAQLVRAFHPAPHRAQEAANAVASAQGERPFVVLTIPSVQRIAFHVGALPWVRSLLVTETVLERLERDELHSVIAYECYSRSDSSGRRTLYWLTGISASAALFFLCLAYGFERPQVFAATWGLATFATTWLLWQANRQATAGRSRFTFATLRELHPQSFAHALRRMQPHHRQVLPFTSRQPLRPELYDRLTALGHDPGPPPPRPH